MNFLAIIGGRLELLLDRFIGEPSAGRVRTAFGNSGAFVEQEPTVMEQARIPHTTIPAPPHNDDAEGYHHRQMEEVSAIGVLDILLVGDSIAQQWPLAAWRPWTVFSLGVGGDLTQHVLWRLDEIIWGTCQPMRILIVAGTNNLLFGESHTDVAAGIEAIAERLDAAHPTAEVFVLLPPPLGLNLQRAATERQALKALLTLWFGPRLIDADAAMFADGLMPNPNYHLDFVHLTECGYKELTRAVLSGCGQTDRASNGS